MCVWLQNTCKSFILSSGYIVLCIIIFTETFKRLWRQNVLYKRKKKIALKASLFIITEHCWKPKQICFTSSEAWHSAKHMWWVDLAAATTTSTTNNNNNCGQEILDKIYSTILQSSWNIGCLWTGEKTQQNKSNAFWKITQGEGASVLYYVHSRASDS